MSYVSQLSPIIYLFFSIPKPIPQPSAIIDLSFPPKAISDCQHVFSIWKPSAVVNLSLWMLVFVISKPSAMPAHLCHPRTICICQFVFVIPEPSSVVNLPFLSQNLVCLPSPSPATSSRRVGTGPWSLSHVQGVLTVTLASSGERKTSQQWTARTTAGERGSCSSTIKKSPKPSISHCLKAT